MGFPFLLMLGTMQSCTESPNTLQRKLDLTLQDDLRYMVAEVQRATGKAHLLDTPYYKIHDLRLYTGDSAWKYGGYADVYFFIYKDIAIVQERKFRYDVDKRYWDRYFKKQMFLNQVPKENGEN